MINPTNLAELFAAAEDADTLARNYATRPESGVLLALVARGIWACAVQLGRIAERLNQKL